MKSSIVIIGAGGHAKVVLEVVNSMGMYDVFGCTDLKEDNALKEYGVHYIGNDDCLREVRSKVHYAAMGIGGMSNLFRQNVYKKIKSMGFGFPALIHSSCCMSQYVNIGEATVLMPKVVINPGARIGKNVIINTGTIVEHDCIIEDFVQIGPGAILCGGVKVAKNSFIGAGACILPGISIEENVVIGAGSVVTRRVLHNSRIVGNPAK